DRILLDHHDRGRLLGQAVGCGETRRPRADHEHFDVDCHERMPVRFDQRRAGRGWCGAKANRRWPLYEITAPIAAPTMIAACGTAARTITAKPANRVYPVPAAPAVTAA